LNYFEQMKGRGTRTLNFDDLKRVSRTAKHTKTHFVIVDAIGATKSKKTDSRPLERKPGVPLKDLLGAVAVGAQDEDIFTSLANRLIRLDKKLTEPERERFGELAGGKDIKHVAKTLLEAYDPDIEESQRKEIIKNTPSVFNGKLNEYIENVRRTHDQIIDAVNQDKVLKADWDTFTADKAQTVIQDFKEYIQANKDEIKALSIFYDQPYRRRELTFKMIKEVLEKLKIDKPLLAPYYVWEAYAQIEEVKGNNPKNELTALVSLIRRVTEIDKQLTSYDKTVDKNFQDWVFKKHAGTVNKFTEEQMEWLRMIKDHISMSFNIEKDDFDLQPFNAKGGLGKMWNLFGDKTEEIINELNEALAS
ncbi:MAG: restriction endonuclease subunit R, partial [Candidatus Delongbacteria bacterium]|nr:restriction endonuclease subunit R [Candidatus Delongbacteria bacterium]